MFHGKRVLMIVLVSALLPASLAAQQRTQAPAQQRAPAATQPRPAVNEQQVQQWVAELRQLHGKLEGIQARALQDAQLQSAQASLGVEIKSAMEQADPQLDAQIRRMEVLEGEAVKAQQAGDEAKLRQLVQEAEGIQTRFANAQVKAMQQPGISSRMEAFQTRLQARMVEVDPETPTLVRRFEELEARLNAAMAAPQRQ